MSLNRDLDVYVADNEEKFSELRYCIVVGPPSPI